jgi:hypothetical protein
MAELLGAITNETNQRLTNHKRKLRGCGAVSAPPSQRVKTDAPQAQPDGLDEEDDNEPVPIRLYARVSQVDAYNEEQYNQLPSEPTFTYKTRFVPVERQYNFAAEALKRQAEPQERKRRSFVRKPGIWKEDPGNIHKRHYTQILELKRDSRLPQEIIENGLSLRLGARVMLVANLNQSLGLINGARGKVIGFEGWRRGQSLPTGKVCHPIVEFDNRIIAIIRPLAEMNESRKTIMEMHQLPLVLSWAITVHKAQGQAFDRADVDISRAFTYGQVYTTLSRLKNLEGLGIMAWNVNRIRVDPRIEEFDQKVREACAQRQI